MPLKNLPIQRKLMAILFLLVTGCNTDIDLPGFSSATSMGCFKSAAIHNLTS